jgi:hypothetical protein
MDSARVVSAASEEALVLGSEGLAKGMRLTCCVLSVAILRAVVVLVEGLVARAHYVGAAAASIEPGVPLRRPLAVPLGNRRT